MIIRAKYQKTLIALLMLVFGGQVLASANFSCHNETSSPKTTEHAMDSYMADHSQHLTMDSSADGVTSLDCCSDCDYTVDGCSNCAILPATQNLFSFNVVIPTVRDNESVEGKLPLIFVHPPISC